MYYRNILHKSDSELVRQVLVTQQLSSVKNHWCLQVDEDLRLCDIQLSEFEISQMKKPKFQNLVS